MKKFVRKNDFQIYSFLMFAALASLPFPSYAFVSKMLILWAFYALFLYGNFSLKILRVTERRKDFFIASLPFWLSLAGLVFSDDFRSGLEVIVLKLPLLLVPLLVFAHPIPERIFYTGWKIFAWAVLAAAFSAWAEARIVNMLGWGDFMFYHEFSVFTGKHTTYFAMFVTLALLYFIRALFSTAKISKKIVYVFPITFLMYILYVLNNRTAFLAFLIAVSLMLLLQRGGKKIFFMGGILLVGLFLFQKTDALHKSAHSRLWSEKIRNDIRKRTQLWQLVIKDVRSRHLITGTGTGSSRRTLYQRYKTAGLTDAYLEKYNAHNQFVEVLYDNGILGLLVFLVHILFILRSAIQSKCTECVVTYTVFILFMLTESILERQSGIILYAFWVSFILAQTRRNDNNRLRGKEG